MADIELTGTVPGIPTGTGNIITDYGASQAIATAYMSHTLADDRFDNGALTVFRERLNNELRAQTDEAFHMFQDTYDIQWEEDLRERLTRIMQTVTFFIPIVTPRYFRDEDCRTELRLFLERERELRRNDLILPIYYITTPLLENPGGATTDIVAQTLARRIADSVYVDWRELRFESFDAPRVRKLVAEMAAQIGARMAEVQATQQRIMYSTEPTVPDEFDVFLCHNSADKPIVKQIGEELKARRLRPWLDEWELRPGQPWQSTLEQQIAHIKAAAVFVGHNGIGPWQNLEQQAFLREFVQRQVPVIPVLLPDAPREPGLPVFLAGMTWVDFRKREPDPMEQLIWGITGKRTV